jgi:hypothetical protein
VNGNSYFAGQITINYGMKNAKTLYMPFQYGYGSQYEWQAACELAKAGYIEDSTKPLWHLKDKGIILRLSIQRDRLKRDVRAFGEE